MRIDVERMDAEDYLAPGWDVTVRVPGVPRVTTYNVTEAKLRAVSAPVSPEGAAALAMLRRLGAGGAGPGVTFAWKVILS